MITQIRIDGFKSFVDFKLDVHPRTLLFGVNGAGKSNLFDALRLVAGTVQRGLDATIAEDPRLAARGLFHRGERVDGQPAEVVAERFRIVVGALVESSDGPLPLRIGINVRFEEGPRGRPGRARLDAGDTAVWVSSLQHDDWFSDLDVPGELRDRVRTARRAFLERTDEEYVSIGGIAGGPLGPADASEQNRAKPGPARWGTELHGLALAECAAWQPLALDPAAMRELVPAEAEGPLQVDGGNLALVLDRIERDAPDAFTGLVADLAALVPGILGLRTEFLESREQHDFAVEFSHTGWTAPASLSDGTLRAIALLAAYWDPEGRGLLPVEEIENGMHLAQVAELVRRLSRRADWSQGIPARQLITTTHSPALLAALRNDVSGSLVFLEQADRVDPARGTVSRTTSARPLLARDPDRDRGAAMSPQAVARMLQRLELGAS